MVFDTEEDAEEYALYLRSCTRTGAETLHWSNPGDYDYDEDTFEDPEYEILRRLINKKKRLAAGIKSSGEAFLRLWVYACTSCPCLKVKRISSRL